MIFRETRQSRRNHTVTLSDFICWACSYFQILTAAGICTNTLVSTSVSGVPSTLWHDSKAKCAEVTIEGEYPLNVVFRREDATSVVNE